eukprot:m.143899 g.143899  ORF g.143899 m.143899 type:complete len:144 (+) comp14107_c0_seq1:864-1295(+)
MLEQRDERETNEWLAHTNMQPYIRTIRQRPLSTSKASYSFRLPLHLPPLTCSYFPFTRLGCLIGCVLFRCALCPALSLAFQQFSKAHITTMLQSMRMKADGESQDTISSFQSGEIDLPTFIAEYTRQRQEYHLYNLRHSLFTQ